MSPARKPPVKRPFQTPVSWGIWDSAIAVPMLTSASIEARAVDFKRECDIACNSLDWLAVRYRRGTPRMLRSQLRQLLESLPCLAGKSEEAVKSQLSRTIDILEKRGQVSQTRTTVTLIDPIDEEDEGEKSRHSTSGLSVSATQGDLAEKNAGSLYSLGIFDLTALRQPCFSHLTFYTHSSEEKHDKAHLAGSFGAAIDSHQPSRRKGEPLI